jgi:transposase
MKMRVEQMAVVCYRASNGGHADGPRQTVAHRCTVAQAPAAFAKSQSFIQGRAPARFAARLLRRDPMDFVDRCAVACVAGAISQSGNLLAAPARLGGGRHVGAHLERVCGRAGRSAPAGLVRIIHGRDLHPGKKRGPAVGPTKRGKGTKLLVVADGTGLPVAQYVSSARPAEVTLAQAPLEQLKPGTLRRLIADRAYDSEKLRESLARRDIELICPHRRGRKRPPTQDGRKLRRYGRRWKIERVFAWLQNFRRIATRYEWYPEMYRAFVHVGIIMLLVNRF